MPFFRSGDPHLLLPDEGICHKVRRIPKPDDWDDLTIFSQRTDRSEVKSPQIQDTVFLAKGVDGEVVYFEIKALRAVRG
ncbi:unnamed protein product [uncultured archaeal virus]|jgi:hypothetical protein|uniref:Uncharacterized protein n=1 Tax=uncultured archaeal virus TaxID=1960247 RepID=A0ABM9HVQ8_9VIRU|nr:unnamed protein product [uncultured archaeal virus]CAI3524021.1 unnamed protein product [uncultured archaeal virus]CAI4043402.1 unnamed protein product [uncultured archaeal virus]